jgi:NAD kinase
MQFLPIVQNRVAGGVGLGFSTAYNDALLARIMNIQLDLLCLPPVINHQTAAARGLSIHPLSKRHVRAELDSRRIARESRNLLDQCVMGRVDTPLYALARGEYQ